MHGTGHAIAAARTAHLHFSVNRRDNASEHFLIPACHLPDLRLARRQEVDELGVLEAPDHDQALGQCSRFLASLPEVRALPCSNTAAAAKMAAASPEPGIAAIASPGCAGIYGLNILKEDVADSENNYTRFLCIAREPVIYAGSNRISLILSCGNAPGDLNGILAKIAARGVNMCKLESCPVKGRNFEFMFFIELEASIHEPGVIAMLEELERACQDFSLLGSYAAV